MARSTSTRPSFVWLQVLLVAALACVVIILMEAVRASRTSHAVAERALRDYAGFAAWSYREHLVVGMRLQVDELLGPVNHGEALHNVEGFPDVTRMGTYIPWNEACRCFRPRRGPMPLRYAAFTLGADTVKYGVNLAADPARDWRSDPADGASQQVPVGASLRPAPDEERWLNALLSGVARRTPRTAWGYDLTIAHHDAGVRVFAQRSMPMIDGDTVVYAVEYAPEALDSLLAAVLANRDLLPPSLVAGRDNHSVVDLAVRDTSGAVVYATAADVRWDLDATTQLPASYGGLAIRTQMRPELASTILIGGMPESRVPLLLVVLTLAVVLSVVAAVQLRRETRFAGERADFVANVSHELRTPLTQVRLVLDTLRLGRAGDATTRDRALAVADREVLRLQHLVEGVLRYARGRRDDSPRVVVDVLAEARVVAAEFQPLAAPRGVTVAVSGDDGARVAFATGALRQTLLNLLDNAVKYGQAGTAITVHVAARGTPPGGARITVTDRGPGVPAADRARIFRAFERGSAAKQRATGGSGIGLTIVADIAQEHGGRAWVEDAPGGGACFVVELPERLD